MTQLVRVRVCLFPLAKASWWDCETIIKENRSLASEPDVLHCKFLFTSKDIAIEWYCQTPQPVPTQVSQKFGGNEWMLGNQTSVGPKRDKHLWLKKKLLERMLQLKITMFEQCWNMFQVSSVWFATVTRALALISSSVFSIVLESKSLSISYNRCLPRWLGQIHLLQMHGCSDRSQLVSKLS